MALPRMPDAKDCIGPDGKFTPAFVRFLQDLSDPDKMLAEMMDRAFGSTRGSILYRGASGWAILAPNTAGYFLKDGGVGADPSYAAVPNTGLLEFIETRAVDGDEIFDVSAYNSVRFIGRAVTSSSSGSRRLQVSTDGGSTYLSSSGDYVLIDPATGTESNGTLIALIAADSALARGFDVTIYGINLAAAKGVLVSTIAAGTSPWRYIPTTSAITHVKFFNSVGTPNGGNIDFYGITA